jgi:cytochrome c oxidase assembly protein subunit 15
MIKKIALFGVILALIVVTLGAYTRLTHAGLGCPDWPGCYGFFDVPDTHEQISQAKIAFPEHEVVPHKAWNEMIHRYFAGTLGLVIAALFFLSLKQRQHGAPVKLVTFLVLLVIFQAALGMWTVTMKLMPVVVMGHLLGGFTTLFLLYLLFLRQTKFRIPGGDNKLRSMNGLAIVGIIILMIQIALGGWTAANYAALVCTELPICQAGWVEQLNFAGAFDLIPPEHDSYEYGILHHAERVTIHVVHRLGAIVTALYLGWFIWRVLSNAQSSFMKSTAKIAAFLLVLQISLGISNIWFSLPLAVAVSHNLVAALLMMSLITLAYSLKRKI